MFPTGLEQEKLHGESPYNIMFGPDICGMNKIVHVIFNYKGQNLLKKVTIPAKADEDPHVYTLVVSADNTYKVLIDNTQAASGELEDDWDFLKPKEIPDPDAKKPSDWDDRAEVCAHIQFGIVFVCVFVPVSVFVLLLALSEACICTRKNRYKKWWRSVGGRKAGRVLVKAWLRIRRLSYTTKAYLENWRGTDVV